MAAILFSGCASAPYSARDTLNRRLGDDVVRYGSIAAAGAGGYFAGRAIGRSGTAGAIGAAVGALGAYGLNKFYDRKRQDAYEAGLKDGEAAARAEEMQKKYEREVIYGLPSEACSAGEPTKRRVYVPEREVNGVKYRGGYQTVDYYN